MEPIIKEKETVYVDGYGGGRYGGGNHQAKSNWALGLGILGSVTGVTALARQGGGYGQREQPWMHQGPQNFPGQGWGGGPMPNIDPRYFL